MLIYILGFKTKCFLIAKCFFIEDLSKKSALSLLSLILTGNLKLKKFR